MRAALSDFKSSEEVFKQNHSIYLNPTSLFPRGHPTPLSRRSKLFNLPGPIPILTGNLGTKGTRFVCFAHGAIYTNC